MSLLNCSARLYMREMRFADKFLKQKVCGSGICFDFEASQVILICRQTHDQASKWSKSTHNVSPPLPRMYVHSWISRPFLNWNDFLYFLHPLNSACSLLLSPSMKNHLASCPSFSGCTPEVLITLKIFFIASLYYVSAFSAQPSPPPNPSFLKCEQILQNALEEPKKIYKSQLTEFFFIKWNKYARSKCLLPTLP